jgi:putative ATP-dependent endonuclease of OLD family
VLLRELHVENLRAIRTARLRLDASTTLIGENDSGKGSLLRALELVLDRDGGQAVTAADFHHDRGATEPSGPLRVTLIFEERTPGEWNSAWHAPVQAHLRSPNAGLRQLMLHTTYVAATDGRADRLALEVPSVREEAARRALVDHVRATTPLIRLTGGMLTGHVPGEVQRTLARLGASRPAEGVAALVERILRAADHVLAGTATDLEACVEAGAQAARDLLAQSPRHFDPAGGGLATAVLEILGGIPASAVGVPGRAPRRMAPTTMAERLGTLLLLAAVLRRMPAGLPPGVEPLWVIEDPEAHLHPMTLTSAERVIEQIRWQKIVTTQSGDLLAAMPLAQVRRLIRHEGTVRAAGLRPRALSREHLRRVGYHLRLHRGVAMFARVWLLVEGESEFWILPQVAQVMGYDLPLEGICCVGFAQCGIDPLVRTAREFGIEWHLLADGDEAGQHYVDAARGLMRRGEERDRITCLPERDIEHCFWDNGHADTIREVAGLAPGMARRLKPTQVIARAVQRRSKPFLALSLVESVARQGPGGVPAPLARLVETCVSLARTAPARAVATADRRGAGGRS